MSKLWLISGSAGLSILVIISILLGLTQQPTEFEHGSPEAAVQKYLIAAVENDYETAYSLFSKEFRDQCPMRDFAGGTGAFSQLDNSRVTYEETKYVQETSVVITRVTYLDNGGPFGSMESSHEQRFTLMLENGEWKMSGESWPLYSCNTSIPRPLPDRPEQETFDIVDPGG